MSEDRLAAAKEGADTAALEALFGRDDFDAVVLNAVDKKHQQTVLYRAAANEHEEVCTFLLEHPEQFTAMLPEGEPGDEEPSAANLGRPRLGLKGVEGAALERRPSASSSPGGSIREQRPGVPRVPRVPSVPSVQSVPSVSRVPTPTPPGTSSRVVRPSGAGSRSSAGATSRGS